MIINFDTQGLIWDFLSRKKRLEMIKELILTESNPQEFIEKVYALIKKIEEDCD